MSHYYVLVYTCKSCKRGFVVFVHSKKFTSRKLPQCPSCNSSDNVKYHSVMYGKKRIKKKVMSDIQ
jgi:transposase-like protein